MKFFPLIWRNLGRRKIRTIFTLLSVFVAFGVEPYAVAVGSDYVSKMHMWCDVGHGAPAKTLAGAPEGPPNHD